MTGNGEILASTPVARRDHQAWGGECASTQVQLSPRSAELGLTLGQLIHQCDVDDAAFLGIVVPLQSPQNDPGEALAIGSGLDLLDAVRVVSDNSESATGPAL